TAILQHVRAGRSRHASRWLTELLQRKKPKLVAVALANKNARIVWSMLSGNAAYQPDLSVKAA
ncbi:IS110 family transposase, partial [Sinorhizobium sp. 8-89]|nr:IS110 family transposase [Sinorhizobium sp. 7-81]